MSKKKKPKQSRPHTQEHWPEFSAELVGTPSPLDKLAPRARQHLESRLYAFAIKYVGDAEQARDLVQITLMKLSEKQASDVADERSLHALARNILRCRIVDWYRATARRRNLLNRYQESLQTQNKNYSTNVDNLISRIDIPGILCQSIESDENVKAFALATVYKYSSRELGEILGISPEAARKRVQRGRKKAKQLLRARGYGGK
ncbi:MAG: sigma-70 family RNA polymerase sigma factor [Proteobacteria bacterium]|nr:sigma-70 family RNA polymerase sigma factor [Pseudomonadota bacterium]